VVVDLFPQIIQIVLKEDATSRNDFNSPFVVRLVCRLLNDILVEHLFREVYLGHGWKTLRISPPLEELVSGRADVFRENAKALTIDSLYKSGDSHLNQGFRTPEIPFSVGENAWQPFLLQLLRYITRERRWICAKLEELLARCYWVYGKSRRTQVCLDFFHTRAPCINLTSTRWIIRERDCPDWYFQLVTRGVSMLPKLRGLHLMRAHGSSSSATQPFFREMKAAICNMINLRILKLHFQQGVPPDFDDFWLSLAESSVRLESITTVGISMGLFHYAAAYSGIKTLVFQIPTSTSDSPRLAEMPRFFFQAVLPKQQDSLEVLGLPSIPNDDQDWSVLAHTAASISKCKSLHSITMGFSVSLAQKSAPNFVCIPNLSLYIHF